MQIKSTFFWVGCLLVSMVARGDAQDLAIAGEPYAPEAPIVGKLEIVGSTLMQPLAVLWSREFRKIHPEAEFDIDCQGSESVLQRLAKSNQSLGMVSRDVTDQELAEAAKSHASKYVAVTVGIDALAVIVHPSNPLDNLSWDARRQSIYPVSIKRYPEKWSELGLDAPLGEHAIAFQIPDQDHGLRTYADSLLLGGDAAPASLTTSHNVPNAIVRSVADNPDALGLVSAQWAQSRSVKVIPIATSNRRLVSPLDAQCIELGYPLVRTLSLVLRTQDDGTRDPLMEEFVRFVLSRRGQSMVAQDGFFPLNTTQWNEQQEKLGWSVVE